LQLLSAICQEHESSAKVPTIAVISSAHAATASIGQLTAGLITIYEWWCLQDRSLLRKNAKAWKNVSTRKEQDDLFAAHGICWSELWRLPYWDPPRMLVVDLMHCLLEGLVKFHF